MLFKRHIINNYGKEILDIANFFDIHNIMAHVKTILKEFAENNLGNNADDLVACRIKTLESASAFDLSDDNIQPALTVINKRGAEIFEQFVKDNIGKTEEDAKRCRIMTEELAAKMSLEEPYTQKAYKAIEDKLIKIDIDYRTVNGAVFDTREAADQARNDVKSYIDILEYSGEFKFKSDFLRHIEKIRALPIDKKVIESYVKKYQEKLERFNKLCSQAAHHEYRSTHGNNPFWNGDIKSMGIQYAIIAIPVFISFVVL